MKKLMNNLMVERQGSSLLVALLVMGILLTLTLGLSSLVVREIRQTSETIDAGKAYYAAEAGVEQALYSLSQSLPGYETNDWVELNEEDIDYRYQINNKGDKIPYFPSDEPVFLTPDQAVPADFLYSDQPSETYNVLGLNETVTIPLFTDNGDGTYEDVDHFLVQYYVDFDIEDQLKQAGWSLEQFDILRWKVFGNPADDTLKTDAISDFYPAHSNDGPSNPVCIGSDGAAALRDGSNYNCLIPVAQQFGINNEGQVTGEIDEAEFGAAWSQARECYVSEAGVLVAPTPEGVHRGCSIQTFIDTHDRNYITLTNVVNPDIVGISNIDLRAARANIYYRVIADPTGPQLVRDLADIKADGFARDGQIRQSIDVKLQMSSFLPVFNFSLYRTDTEDDTKDSPTGGEQESNFPFFNIPLEAVSL